VVSSLDLDSPIDLIYCVVICSIIKGRSRKTERKSSRNSNIVVCCSEVSPHW
jgi:hypothetical protein